MSMKGTCYKRCKMTKAELEYELETLKEENQKLRNIVAEYMADETGDYYDDEAKVNRWVAERLAEEDRRNDERAENDPDFAWELRQIRYMESRYDDEYGW